MSLLSPASHFVSPLAQGARAGGSPSGSFAMFSLPRSGGSPPTPVNVVAPPAASPNCPTMSTADRMYMIHFCDPNSGSVATQSGSPLVTPPNGGVSPMRIVSPAVGKFSQSPTASTGPQQSIESNSASGSANVDSTSAVPVGNTVGSFSESSVVHTVSAMSPRGAPQSPLSSLPSFIPGSARGHVTGSCDAPKGALSHEGALACSQSPSCAGTNSSFRGPSGNSSTSVTPVLEEISAPSPFMSHAPNPSASSFSHLVVHPTLLTPSFSLPAPTQAGVSAVMSLHPSEAYLSMCGMEATGTTMPSSTASTPANCESNSRSPIIEVYDPDFKFILSIPAAQVLHRPCGSGITRLVLCRNFRLDNPQNCAKGELCKFVHADVTGVMCNSIHVRYTWRSAEHCPYPRLPPGDRLVVMAPNVRPPPEVIPSEHVLVTRGSVGCRQHKDTLSHCAHYYFNRVCNRGERCSFIHSLYIDPNAKNEGKRAPPPMTVAPIMHRSGLSHHHHGKLNSSNHRKAEETTKPATPQHSSEAPPPTTGSYTHGSTVPTGCVPLWTVPPSPSAGCTDPLLMVLNTGLAGQAQLLPFRPPNATQQPTSSLCTTSSVMAAAGVGYAMGNHHFLGGGGSAPSSPIGVADGNSGSNMATPLLSNSPGSYYWLVPPATSRSTSPVVYPGTV